MKAPDRSCAWTRSKQPLAIQPCLKTPRTPLLQVLWECLTGQVPWASCHPMQVVGAVGFHRKSLPCPDAACGDAFLVDLCMRCMAHTPALRPSFSEIVEVSSPASPSRAATPRIQLKCLRPCCVRRAWGEGVLVSI